MRDINPDSEENQQQQHENTRYSGALKLQHADEATRVHSVYHDGDGSVYTYNKAGDLLPYPSEWPEHIGHVYTFCQERGIIYRR